MANAMRFFKSLPGDELTPMEHSIRKALLKAIRGQGGKPFPLIEWIDRRVGGEIESVRDENGQVEIRLRDGADGGEDDSGVAAGEAGATDEFFAILPADRFDPPEEALREAVFEFLATWTSPTLAGLKQLIQYPEVVRRSKAFLPRGVAIKDWIEHRIGGEIEFRPGQRGSGEVVHLTDSARGAVMAKYQHMAVMGPMGKGGHGPSMMGHGPPMGQPMGMGPPPPPPQDMGRPGAGPVDKDTYFDTLPADEMMPSELALREAVLSWLRRWPMENKDNKKGVPHLSDAGGDAEIKRCRQELLPGKIKLADWIERRIGGEVELKAVANGQHEVYLKGRAARGRGGGKGRGREDGEGGGGEGGGGGGGKGNGKHSPAAAEEAKERFWATLPDDEFSDAEDNLRAALLDFLEQWTGENPPTVGDLSQSEEVGAARREVIPKGCPVGIRDWIDRRIGGEIETAQGPGGKWIFGPRGTLAAAVPEGNQAAQGKDYNAGAKGNAGAKRRRMG